jgi:class 3 adenylate cyclase
MTRVQSALPSGTVTFLFTDIEGSTRLLQELGDAYGDLVRDHRRLVRESFGENNGSEVDAQGDAFFYSFGRARDAVAAAVAAQRALAEHPWPEGAELRVRMGLHTGEPTVGEEGYLGLDVVRAARICSAGHGGQILMSETTRALLGNDVPVGASLLDLGQQNLKDVQHERIFQLSLEGEGPSFPPLKTYPHKDRPDALADKFEQRIDDFVQRSLDQALAGAGPPDTSGLMKLGLSGIGVLVVFVVVIVALVLLIKLAF